jgi:hypothetical protein
MINYGSSPRPARWNCDCGDFRPVPDSVQNFQKIISTTRVKQTEYFINPFGQMEN